MNYKETPIRVSADFCTEALQARGSGKIYLSVERKAFATRILYPARISFKIEGERKNFCSI